MKEMTSDLRTQSEQGHPAHRVAEQILWHRRDEEMIPMHVVKLVYICHGWMLGFHGRNLISEAVEAWRYGPVVPSIYFAYKVFGGAPVTNVPVDQSDIFDDAQRRLIDKILKAYASYDALALSSITHQEGTPWFTTYKGGKDLRRKIPNRLIEKYYKARLKFASS